MKTSVIGLLVVWACLSWGRLDAWQTDAALWEAAAAVSPTPRALVNLASVEIRRGQWRAAYLHGLQALEAAALRPGELAVVQDVVRRQFRLIDLFEPICGRPVAHSSC